MNGLQSLWKVRLVHAEVFVQDYVLVLVQADVAERVGILALDAVTLAADNAVEIVRELAVQHVQVALEIVVLHAVEVVLKLAEDNVQGDVMDVLDAKTVVLAVELFAQLVVLVIVNMAVPAVKAVQLAEVVVVRDAKDAVRLVKTVVLLVAVDALIIAAQGVQENV